MATILRSHLDAALQRRSQQDANAIFDGLAADGNLSVEEDEVVEDDEGNVVPPPFPEAIEVTTDAEEDAEDVVLTPNLPGGAGPQSEEDAMKVAEQRAANAPPAPKAKAGNGRKKAEEPKS